MARVLKSEEIRKCMGCFTCQRVCSAINHQSYSDFESAILVRTLGGISTGMHYATHCLACTDERACMNACLTGAITARKGGGVVFNQKKCVMCQKCAKACIINAIYFTGKDTFPIICRHCGVCARYCPHKCLTMEEVPDDQ